MFVIPWILLSLGILWQEVFLGTTIWRCLLWVSLVQGFVIHGHRLLVTPWSRTIRWYGNHDEECLRISMLLYIAVIEFTRTLLQKIVPMKNNWRLAVQAKHPWSKIIRILISKLMVHEIVYGKISGRIADASCCCGWYDKISSVIIPKSERNLS